MNFCKECDEYISLYIDGLLEEEIKSEFLKHAEQCNECSAKFKAATYISELCKEEIPLPEDFSSSLHNRLQEASRSINKKNNESKFMLIIHSKKLIASLSTAAVLVISLLAYNLLPNMSPMKLSSQDAVTTQLETEQTENKKDSDIDNSVNRKNSTEVEESAQYQASSNSFLSNDQDKDAEQSVAVVVSEDKEITQKFSKSISSENKENNDSKNIAKKRNLQGDVVASTSSDDTHNNLKDDSTIYMMTSGNASDSEKHISNYSEIKIKVSAHGTEIEDIKTLMSDIGGCQLITHLNDSIIEKSDANSAESADKANSDNLVYALEKPDLDATNYIDYYLTLEQYSMLASQASKYNLEIISKTDIIKKDISQIYNDLNKQKIEINKKIAEASKNGEDISAYEAEKAKITEEINKIGDIKEMVVVRIFFELS